MKIEMKVLNALLITMSICAVAVFIHGCKKTEKINELIITEDVSQRVKKALAENPEMGRIILPVNEKVQGHWEDGKGNIITTLKGSNAKARLYECASAADVAWPPGATLVSIGQDYNCNQGYKLTFTFNISISVNLRQSFICSGTTNTSKGRIRIKNNTSGATLYSDLAIPVTSITDLGDDINTGGDNALFKVVYTTQWIPFANFDPSQNPLITSSVYTATDCCLLPVFATAYTSGSLTPSNTNPYLRVDPISYLSGTLPITAGSIANRAQFLGYGNIVFASSCPTPPGGYPERQEIQVRLVGQTNWKTIAPQLGTWNVSPFGNLNPFVATTTVGAAGDQRGTIGMFDAYYVPDKDCYQNPGPIHGNYQVQWRNKKVSVVPFVNGPWSTP